MTWFKVDDGFYDHPKVIEAMESKHGKGAIALWTLCGSWCGKHETDGVVPAAVAKRLGGTPQEIELLLAVRLWSRVDAGFSFHGWAERNPLKDSLEEKREKTKKRVAEWRAKSAGNVVGNAVTNTVGNAAPIPTRPDPTRPDQEEREGERAGARPTPPRPVESLPFESNAWTAERAAVVFRALFFERYRTEPSMGGKHLAGFAERVANTARPRRREPEELYREVLSTWLLKPRSDAEKRAPFACFVQAWGELTMAGGGGRDVRRGYVPSAPVEAYEGREQSPEEIFGLKPEGTHA